MSPHNTCSFHARPAPSRNLEMDFDGFRAQRLFQGMQNLNSCEVRSQMCAVLCRCSEHVWNMPLRDRPHGLFTTWKTWQLIQLVLDLILDCHHSDSYHAESFSATHAAHKFLTHLGLVQHTDFLQSCSLHSGHVDAADTSTFDRISDG